MRSENFQFNRSTASGKTHRCWILINVKMYFSYIGSSSRGSSSTDFLYSLRSWTWSNFLIFGALLLLRGFRSEISLLISVSINPFCRPHILCTVTDKKKEGFVLDQTPNKVCSLCPSLCAITGCQLLGMVDRVAAHTCCEVRGIV